MFHCSFMERLSSPPSSSMLILGVEGSVIFEELVLRVRFKPMIFFFVVSLRFGFRKRRDKEK